jgi:addiction module HigA family antidote
MAAACLTCRAERDKTPLMRNIPQGKTMARPDPATRPAPLHPGFLLRYQVLPGLDLSVSQAARELRIARQTLHRVLAGTAAITPEMAARLGSGLNCTSR